MDIMNSFIKVHLCGTDHQREVGLRGLRLICGGGTIEVSEGFWQLEPAEVNTTITSWCKDIDDIASEVIRFLEIYQRYASQTAIFVQYKDQDRHGSVIVYAGEWPQALRQISHVEQLLDYFDQS